MKMPNYQFLDDEEKELIESYEAVVLDDIKPPTLVEQKRFKDAAKEYIKHESKMNIRIDKQELQQIKNRALHDGLKYSTWVKMILHKYLTGQLVEKVS